MSEPLQPLTFPLWGSRLIEASAGTGKTWTIAALYVRLVLGHGGTEAGFCRPLLPSEILVMTFTRAATRELSDRIRARLVEAARCFRGETRLDQADDFLRSLYTSHPEIERSQAAFRLATAAQCMDEAGVFTIDAWCQRMLREHAFDSAALFDETLVPDEQALLTEAVQDYWREQVYPLSRDNAAEVLKVWKTIDACATDMGRVVGLTADRPLPANATDLRGVLTTLTEAAIAARGTSETLARHVAILCDWLDDQLNHHQADWNGVKFGAETVRNWMRALREWAACEFPQAPPDLGKLRTRLTPAGLQDARKAKAPPITIPEGFAWFENVVKSYDALAPLSDQIRLHAAAAIARRVAVLKGQARTFGFADLLRRLDLALDHPESGERLRHSILAQYPVALIDEFQDTSPIQYRIFDKVYRCADHGADRALVLIGDPKQSIYGFRGADIYSYLNARQATEGRHYALPRNFRSTDTLVGVVNQVFAQAEQREGAGAFAFRADQGNRLPFEPVAAQGRKEVWQEDGQPLPALCVHFCPEMLNAEGRLQHFAGHCAEQIVQWLNAERNGFAEGTAFTRLQPKDIAVLVRDGKEAAAVRAALQQRGVASVYLSEKESVYQSPEASALVHWLRGVAEPHNAALVRAALALDLIDMPLADLATIAAEDEVFEQHAATLAQLREVWQGQGVLALLRQSLHRLDLPRRWLAGFGGERRMTNYLHLAELLQAASATVDGEQALIRWLVRQIEEARDNDEEQVVRLESDDDLVKIVTVHKSKGLEYPVVCLPFGTSFKAFRANAQQAALLPSAASATSAGGERDLVLALDDQVRARVEQERLREDLRLLYVALTRARHALWVGFAAVKVGTGKDCQSHQSALGYLVGGSTPRSPEEWAALWGEWHRQQGTAMALVRSEQAAASTALQTRSNDFQPRDAAQMQRRIDRRWTVASYSRIVRDLQTAASQGAANPQSGSLTELTGTRRTDDEGRAEPGTADTPVAAPLRHRLPRGAASGTFLHDQLEWLAAEGFRLTDETVAQVLRERCVRSGHSEDDAAELLQWLTQVVQTPLSGPGVALAELGSVKPEMEFWLPIERLDSARFDAVCQAQLLGGVPRPTLQRQALHGMLMGFADLVFEHAGRFWVLDYKSNALGAGDADYTADAMNQAMARHRYEVQAVIYMVALERLLQSRLGEAYDRSRHLGGAVYLFLRGVAGTAAGSVTVPPDSECLDALAAMLQSQTEEA